MMRCAKRCLAQLALASALLTAALAMPRTGASGNGSTAMEGSSAPTPGRNLSVSAARANDWEPVRRAIDAFDLVPDCAVSVAYSDSDENVFEHEKGDTTMSTLMPIASATKWVSGVTIMNVVQKGAMGLDDFAHQHLTYWTQDPEDARSSITLRHFLAFTSGYTCSTGCAGAASLSECMRQIYTQCGLSHAPGTRCDYQEIHLQFAGAMAEAATKGRNFVSLANEYVTTPLGMSETRWNSDSVPLLGSGLTTNAIEYGAFLRSYANGRILSPALRAEMERLQFPDAQIAGLGLAMGRYSLGNWFECIANLGTISEQCLRDDVHSSPGIRGYYPATDRRFGYNSQIAFNGASGVGAALGAALHLAIKPLVEAAVQGHAPSEQAMRRALDGAHWRSWATRYAASMRNRTAVAGA